MAYQFLKANQSRYTITEMAGLLGVSRSAYYKWAKRGVSSRRKEADAELLRLIRQIVSKHHRRYGSPRVLKELRNVYGIRVSLKKVACLMRENGLNAHRRRRFIPAADSKHAENVLNRMFPAQRSGEKWLSDITYLRTLGGWVYLTMCSTVR